MDLPKNEPDARFNSDMDRIFGAAGGDHAGQAVIVPNWVPDDMQAEYLRMAKASCEEDAANWARREKQRRRNAQWR